MKITKIKRFFSNSKFRHVITFLISFICIYLILFTAVMTKKYDLKEGSVASENIKAPIEIKDEAETKTKIQQASDSVSRQYTKDTDVKNSVVSNINEFFYKISELNDTISNVNEKLSKLKSQSSITLSDSDYTTLLKLNKNDLENLRAVLTSTMSEIYNGDIMEDNSKDISNAQEEISVKINSSTLSKNLKDLGITIGYSQIKPNLFYDEKKTEELKNETMSKVSPVMIKKDQIVVKEGEIVTKHDIEILSDLGVLNTNNSLNLYKYLSLGFLILIVMCLEWYYVYKENTEMFRDCSKLVMISMLTCLELILARTLSIISPYLIPLALAPMLIALLTEDRKSLILNIMNCILISVAVNFDIQITIFALVNAVLGTIILRKMQQRNDIIYSSLYMGIINILISFSMGFLMSSDIVEISKRAGFVFLGSVISGILTIGCLPLFESTFDIVTTIKLLELSNPNNPLLKRLLMEAPGTYHHSVMVANLAEVASEAVGANPVLARVSSYYHDVGKLKRPYFFKENQLGNDNPHNKITPHLSTLIIISHVKDGVELAKEYKIPKIISDIIQQHHGTTLVKYFYVTMKNSSEKPDEVNKEDFMYPGPIPMSKEAGVVMLADSVEASVRSIPEPTNGKIEEMVNNIIKDRLNEGQLDNCDLTLKDIDKIRKSFLKVLSGIYHKRIEYPVDKWQDTNEKSSEGDKSGADRQQTK